MKSIFVVLFLLYFFILQINSKVLFAVVLTRHGDRFIIFFVQKVEIKFMNQNKELQTRYIQIINLHSMLQANSLQKE